MLKATLCSVSLFIVLSGPAWSDTSENLPNPDVNSGVPGNFNNPGVNCAAKQALTYRNNRYSCVSIKSSGGNACIKCNFITLGPYIRVTCPDGKEWVYYGWIPPGLPSGYCY